MPAPGKSWNTGWPRAPGATFTRSAKQTIEPVFGIIKAALGCRRFSLRGLAKVRTEWMLVTLAYNLKRLFHLGVDLAAAGNSRRAPSSPGKTDIRKQFGHEEIRS